MSKSPPSDRKPGSTRRHLLNGTASLMPVGEAPLSVPEGGFLVPDPNFEALLAWFDQPPAAPAERREDGRKRRRR